MTSIISPENMAKIRAVQERNLPETAYIQSYQKTDDGQGGYTENWETTRVIANARLGEPKGELEREVASSIQAGMVNVITLPADTEVLDTDQIQINGRNYRVHWMNKGKSALTALRVMVTEV
jgi:SPP1 family predicted phage head-tail adaptor